MSIITDDSGTQSDGVGRHTRDRRGFGRLRGYAADLVERWRQAPLFVAPDRATWPLALRRLRRAGFILLVLEFIGACLWSANQVHRFALSGDFAAYQQAIYLLGHGHLSPQITTFYLGHAGTAVPFWKNGAEFFIVPLAVLLRIWPHVVVLKWAQDLALVGMQAIAFAWICDIAASRAERDGSARNSVLLAGLGLLLLVANPWFAWSSAFDIHSETFGAFFVIGAARDLHRGRRTAILWAVGGILCSVVCATYVAAVGISALLSSRARLRPAAIVTGMALLWALILSGSHLVVLGGANTFASVLNGGATDGNLQPFVTSSKLANVTYGQLFHAVAHRPQNLFSAIWVNHADLWGTVSAAGLIGIFWLPALIPVLVVLLQGSFYRGFSLPSFQNIVLAPLVAVGTVALLGKLAASKDRRRWFLPVVAVVALNSILWGAIWFPKLDKQWIDVSPSTSSVLRNLKAKIGPKDEVIASQGVSGGFGTRQWMYPVRTLPLTVQVGAPHVWFIVTPTQGIEITDPSASYAAIAQLEATPGMRLVTASNGVFAFEWTPPSGTRTFTLGAKRPTTPGWVLAGVAGKAVNTGSPSDWHTVSTGKPGYVVDQAYWRSLPGHYRASVSMSVTGKKPVNVEVWDARTSTLLGRRVVAGTGGRKTISFNVQVTKDLGAQTVNGWGPWAIAPLNLKGDAIEIRVWSPGGSGVTKVYGATLKRLGTTARN
jgi:hypothetical protein